MAEGTRVHTAEQGCQYHACEDLAPHHVKIADSRRPTDLFLCPSHEPYVRRALAPSNRNLLRLTLEELPFERTRVRVSRFGP